MAIHNTSEVASQLNPQAKLVIRLAISSSLVLIYSGFCSSAQANTASDNRQNEPAIYHTSVSTADTNIPIAYFDPIVITATRSQKSLSDAPVAMQVIDSQTLQDHHAHTLKDALQLLPNVSLVPLHGKTGYEVRMQGFSGDQVLILIDGLPISASTGSTVNLNQYLNTNVAQIEVIQGAASAQYGSSAMGGVINVITQPILDTQSALTIEVGSNGSQNPSAKLLDNNHSYIEGSIEGAVLADGRLKVRLSGSYLEDKGLSVDTEAWPLLKDPSKQQQLTAKMTYTPNIIEVDQLNPSSRYWLEASLYAEEDISRFNYYVPPKYLKQQRDEDIMRQRLSMGGVTHLNPFFNSFNKTSKAHKPDDHSNTATPISSNQAYKLSGSALYENYESDSDTQSYNDSGSTLTSARDAQIEMTLAQAQLDFPIIYSNNSDAANQSHGLQVGVSGRLDTLQQTKNKVSELTSDDVRRNVLEAYIQDDWMIGTNLEVVVGARYQDDSDFGGHFAPKLAVKQDYFDNADRKHTFRASIGSGYRVPNLKERHYVFDHSNFGYKVMGNPSLMPETSTSYQLGYQTNVSADVSLIVNGFYNDVEDLIQTDNSNPDYDGNIAVYRYNNINKAATYGADASMDWQINNQTKLNLAYAYLHTENQATGSDLTYSPEHKITANLDYQLTDKLQLIQKIRYESQQLVNTTTQSYSPSWWGLDSRANYSATPHLDIYAAINNLLDEQRKAADADDQRPVDNRQWLLGASYHW